jgi:hypothetical protein
MIAHVAEASELSGRVVLWLDPETRYAPALLEAPVRLAAAYGAEIETVVVSVTDDDNSDDLDDASNERPPIRRLGRRANGELPEASGESRAFALLTERCRRAVEEAGAVHSVKVRHALAHGDAVDRISEMCLARGPWNIVALARTPGFAANSLIGTLLANVSGATGFLLCGEHAARAASRVVVIVEDADRLPSMLRAAERLAPPNGKVHIVIAADTAVEYAELEAQARLLTSDQTAIAFEQPGPTFGVPGALTELVARLKPGLVVARFGGSAFTDGRELARASVATRAPILLVR